MYRFFCIFIIIIVIIIIRSSISTSVVALLNCLYLNPRVFPFVHSAPHASGGGEERRGERAAPRS